MHADPNAQTAREQLVSYCGRLAADGLAVGSAGNMSVRVGDHVAITPSGVPYADVAPADMCIVTLAGDEIEAPETPSSQLPMHLAIYPATDAGAVVHTHSADLIAVSAGRDDL